MKLMKKVLSGLALVLAVSTSAWAASDIVKVSPLEFTYIDHVDLSNDTQEAKFVAGLKRIHSAMSWIRDGGRHTTGNSGFFWGDEALFYPSNTSYPQGGSDRSFGYVLQYTYDMYCSMKGRSNYCLGSRLKVEFQIKTRSVSGGNVYARYKAWEHNSYVRGSYVTSSTKPMMYLVGDFWKMLNTKFGAVSNYNETTEYFQRRYVPISLVMLTDASGNFAHIDDVNWLAAVNRDMNRYPTTGNIHFRIAEVVKLSSSYSNKSVNGVKLNEKMLGDLLTYRFNSADMLNRKTNYINIISTPKRQNDWGYAWIHDHYSPAMSFNQWIKYQPADMYKSNVTLHAAKIWLHELGHNLNYRHSDSSYLHADNYYYHKDGAAKYNSHLSKMNPKTRFGTL